MRPIRSPQHPIRSVVDERLGEGNRVVEWLPGRGGAPETGDLDPAFLIAPLQIEQRLEARIVETLDRLRRAHVVDGVTGRERRQDRRKVRDRARIEIDIDVPTDLCRTMGEPSESGHVLDPAQPLEKGEAAAAHASLVECIELRVADRVGDDGEPLVLLGIGSDGVGVALPAPNRSDRRRMDICWPDRKYGCGCRSRRAGA